MFEEMGEAGTSRLLVPRANAVPQVHGHRRGDMIRTGDHPQTVVQPMCSIR